uniref:DUF4283 domain-containing protein n=1 Tax=Cannabis sativa TaxID=3483 RepID=A0A803PD60_CANSA
MDDLAYSLSVALSLTDVECTMHTLHDPTPSNVSDPNAPAIYIFLVAKLHTIKSFNKKVFMEKMDWSNISHFPVTIIERTKGLFLVEFGCVGDRRRVLLQQPWTYMRQAILMDIPNSLDALNGDTLIKLPLWVQVHNTSFLKKSEQLDVALPLPMGIPINFFGINKVVWLELKYENIPDICFFCGCMGHTYNNGCMEYMKACDETPLPLYLKYDSKAITGKVKVLANPLLSCPEQINFANPPIATLMTSNPARNVCVSLPETISSLPP